MPDFSSPPEAPREKGEQAPDAQSSVRLDILPGVWLQRMDGFAFDQHRDVFLDSGRSGLGLFGGMDPVKDRVAVGTIKRFEKAFCLFMSRQRGAEIVRHLRRAL